MVRQLPFLHRTWYLGLYYITKGKKSTAEEKVKGEGKAFYSAEEVIIAYNEKQIDLHANIR